MGAGASKRESRRVLPEQRDREDAAASAGVDALAACQARVQELLAEVDRLRRQDGEVVQSFHDLKAPPPNRTPTATSPTPTQPQPEQAKPKASILRRLSAQADAQGDLREELELHGGLNKQQVRELLSTRGREELDDDALDELFSTCDLNNDGTVDLAEFEQALQLMCPTASPETYVEEMVSAAGIAQMLVGAIVQSARQRCNDDPVEALTRDFSAEHFLEAIDSVKRQQAEALAAECAKLCAVNKVEKGKAGSNSKFATQEGTFEGAYGDLDDFLVRVHLDLRAHTHTMVCVCVNLCLSPFRSDSLTLTNALIC